MASTSLVVNAGVFPPSQRIDALRLDAWRAVMGVNVDSAVCALLRELHPLLQVAPRAAGG